MKKILYGGKIILENSILENKALVFDREIIDIVDNSVIDTIEGEKIFFEGYLSPGWIDIHIHGCNGYDTMDATEVAIKNISETLGKKGVTSFLATTMTMEKEKIVKAVENVGNYMELQKSGNAGGSNLLGVHMEGPFINPDYKGAQDAKHILKPDANFVKPYLDIVKIVTLAPEMDENFEMIRELKDKVVLSAGHTSASYDCACKAHKAGVKHVTHCFNAMSPLHHRNPGMVGAALMAPYSLDLITDFIHFHPDLLEFVIKAKGTEKCILITDGIRATFLGEGKSDLGGQEVTVKDGACRLNDGTIAGSIHTMDKALANTLDKTNYTIPEVISMMTINPAKFIKVDNKKGSLEIGKDADIVVLDENLKVKKVFVLGQLQ